MRARNVAGGVGAGLLIIIIVLLAALAIDGGPIFAWLIEHPLSRLAGYQILVDGPVSVHWGRPTRLVAENVRIANARWSSRPDMFVAQRAEIDIDPRTLLSGPPQVPLVLIEHALLLLESDPDGQRNWDVGHPLLDVESAGGGRLPRPSHIVLRDATFVFRSGGPERMLVADSLAVDLPDATAPIRLSAAGNYRHQPILISGSLGSLDELRRPMRPYPVALEARIADSDLSVHGTTRQPWALAGIEATLTFTGRHLDDLAAAFGLALRPLPELHAAGELSGGDGEWAIKALTASLGRSDVEGGVALSTRGPVPDIRADLTSRVTDLDDLASLVGAARLVASAPPAPRPIEPGGRVTPAASIAAFRMPGMTIEATFHGAHVTASEAPPIEKFAVALRLEDGIVALDPMTFSVAGGDVALKASVNPVPQAPELTLDLDIRRVDLAELARRTPLPPFAKDARGTLGGFVRVRGAGRSLRDFLGSLEGEAGVFAENGEFSPALQQLLAPDVLDALGLDGGTRGVPVSCMISHFNFAKGVGTASTLLLDTHAATLLGQGTVNFGAETI